MPAFLIAIGLKPTFFQTQCTSPISYFSVFKNVSDDLSLVSSFILLNDCFHDALVNSLFTIIMFISMKQYNDDEKLHFEMLEKSCSGYMSI